MLRKLRIGIILFLLSNLNSASAGVVELSGTFSYSQSYFGISSFSWTKRYGVSIGYYFWAYTELELSIQDVLYRTKIGDIEDTTFHDRVYSVELVQMFSSQESFIQPYIKVGVGQLNRDATGRYSDGNTPPAMYDAITGVIGAGIKFKVQDSFTLKVEGTSYLMGGVLSTAKDNFSINGGFGIYF